MKKRYSNLILILNGFLILTLLVSYVFQLEKLTKESYLIEKNQSQIKELEKENLTLGQESYQLVSLEKTENKIKFLGFTETEKIKYIPISVNYLAGEIR